MQRINLSVKILVSHVNTAVLLCEELDITFVGKTLPFLNSEQRKREKQGGENVGSFFYTVEQWAAARGRVAGDGFWQQHFNTSIWGVWWGKRMCKVPPPQTQTVCPSWSFRPAPLQVANSSGLWQMWKHRCGMRFTCKGHFNTGLVK